MRRLRGCSHPIQHSGGTLAKRFGEKNILSLGLLVVTAGLAQPGFEVGRDIGSPRIAGQPQDCCCEF